MLDVACRPAMITPNLGTSETRPSSAGLPFTKVLRRNPTPWTPAEDRRRLAPAKRHAGEMDFGDAYLMSTTTLGCLDIHGFWWSNIEQISWLVGKVGGLNPSEKWWSSSVGMMKLPIYGISPKSIPNSEKQKQLPNTQWMKYVYCPALFTLEVGRASCNHGTNTVWKKRFSKSVCDTVANMPEARAKGSLPKELLSASLFTSST